jgi:predicted porin
MDIANVYGNRRLSQDRDKTAGKGIESILLYNKYNTVIFLQKSCCNPNFNLYTAQPVGTGGVRTTCLANFFRRLFYLTFGDILMKKTLVAAGIAAVVAAPAFAEVQVSGMVKQGFTWSENAAMSESRNNTLTFSASEDLGNGLSAFAKIVLDVDVSAADDSDTQDNIVGLKGGFGTVVTGRMEDFTEGKIHSKATLFTSIDTGGAAVEAMLPSPAGRTDGAIAYVSPTMNGLHFGVATYNDEATDIAVFYDNGPLSIAAAYETQKPSLTGTTTTNDQTTASIAASYAMGDAKVTVVHAKQDNDAGTAANDIDGTVYRLDYKMGNNAITVAYGDGETGAGADNGDVTAIELVHSFSKRTAFGVAYTMDDNPGSTADVDSLSVALMHKF